MRNQFRGICYRCGEDVSPRAGYFERFRGGWRAQHSQCAVKYRGTETVSDKWLKSLVTTEKGELL